MPVLISAQLTNHSYHCFLLDEVSFAWAKLFISPSKRNLCWHGMASADYCMNFQASNQYSHKLMSK